MAATDIELKNSENILETASNWRAQGKHVALVTVISTWGSSPRPVGSQLVVNDQGVFLGSVSGGCIEEAVVSEALDVIQEGKPRVVEYGIANEEAWEVGLTCGGSVHVYIEKIE